MIMGKRNKILVFSDPDEIWRVKYVLEDISEKLEKHGEDDRADATRILVDGFEKESGMSEDLSITGRNLIVQYLDSSPEPESEHYIEVYYGVLNSSDTFISPDQYLIISQELQKVVDDKVRHYRNSTYEVIAALARELALEYQAYEGEYPEKVYVVIEN